MVMKLFTWLSIALGTGVISGLYGCYGGGGGPNVSYGLAYNQDLRII